MFHILYQSAETTITSHRIKGSCWLRTRSRKEFFQYVFARVSINSRLQTTSREKFYDVFDRIGVLILERYVYSHLPSITICISGQILDLSSSGTFQYIWLNPSYIYFGGLLIQNKFESARLFSILLIETK